MSVLIKWPGGAIPSLSGPASRVAGELRGDKDMHVLAFEMKPEQRYLEKPLLKAVEMLSSLLQAQVALQDEKMQRLVDLLIEDLALPQTAFTEAKMRGDAIRHLLTSGKWLTATEIGSLGNYSGSNPAAPANRWKKEGKVFAVTHKGKDFFAAYQFDDAMTPRPVMAEVLTLFVQKRDPWKIAAWFASVNGWLRGKRPQDCLDDVPSVVAAARQEVVGFNG